MHFHDPRVPKIRFLQSGRQEVILHIDMLPRHSCLLVPVARHPARGVSYVRRGIAVL